MVEPTPESGLRPFARALQLRCPRCGSRRVMLSWFSFERICPDCQLQLDRGDQGYLVGSYLVNIIVAELVVVLLLLGVLFGTWPNPPWTLLTYAAPALAVVAPLAFFPFARLLFLAFDLWARPESE